MEDDGQGAAGLPEGSARDHELDPVGEVSPTREMVIQGEFDEPEQVTVSTTVLPPVEDDEACVRQLIGRATAELNIGDENDGTKDSGRAARLHHGLAVVLEERLGDHRGALRHYQRALEHRPGDTTYIRSARRVHWSRQNWAFVVQLLDAELERTTDPSRRAELLLDKGGIYEDWLPNLKAARGAYEAALDADPGSLEILHRLRRVCLRLADHQGFAEVCERALVAVQDASTRSRTYTDLAEVQEQHLDDLDGAIESYEAAFAEDPSNGAACLALKRLYDSTGRWEKLVDVLVSEAEHAQTTSARHQCLLAAARLCAERVKSPERVMALFTQICDDDDADTELLREMADWLAQSGRHKKLVEVYQRLLDGASGGESVILHHRLAELLEQRLGRGEEALVHCRRAVELNPGYLPAIQMLERLCRDSASWEELVQVQLLQLLEVEEPAQRAACLAGVADLYEHRLADVEHAIEYHQRALSVSPGYGLSIRGLERLYLRTEAYADLLELYETQLAAMGDKEAAQLLERMGMIALQCLRERRRAADYLSRALERSPGVASVIRVLQGLYRDLGQWERLLSLLTNESKRCADGAIAMALAQEAAELCEYELGREDEAERRYKAMLQRQPQHWQAVKALARIFESRGGWGELFALYEEAIGRRAVARGQLATLRCRLGYVADNELKQPARAERQYRLALDADAGCTTALRALARLYQRQQRWEDLSESLRKQADLAWQPQEQSRLLAMAGQVFHRYLDRKEEAIGHYKAALALVPDLEPARDGLLEILVTEGHYDEAIELLRSALAASADATARCELLTSLARLLQGPLHKPEEAVACYEQALALVGDRADILSKLIELYAQLNDHSKHVDGLERLAALSEDSSERMRLLFDAARVIDVHLPLVRDPASVYEAILAERPKDRRAMASLQRLYSRRNDLEALVRLLKVAWKLEEDQGAQSVGLFRLAVAQEAVGDVEAAERTLAQAAGMDDDWVVVNELGRLRRQLELAEEETAALQRVAELSRSPENVVGASMRASRLLVEHFNDSKAALGTLRRVLELQPFNEEAAILTEQLLMQRKAWPELLDVMRARVKAAADQGDAAAKANRVGLLVRMAWVQKEHLKQPAAAVASLKAALQLDEYHVPALLELAQQYATMGQWKESVSAYERIVVLSDDADLLRRVHYQLGEIWQEQMRDPVRAISSYQNVLALSSQDRRTLHRMYRIFQQMADWENAADTVKRLLEVESGKRRAQYHVALADILEQGFGDPDSAAGQLGKALELEPANARVVERIVDLYGRLGRWTDQIAAIEAYLAALSADRRSEGVPWRLRLAQLLRRAHRTEDALQQCRLAVDSDPRNLEARHLGARLLAEQGRYEEAVGAHRKVLEIDPLCRVSLSELRALWSRAGDQERAYAAAAALVCSGLSDDGDQRVFRQYRNGGVRVPQAAIDDAVYQRHIMHPGEGTVGRPLLSLLSESAHRIRPPNLEAWQVTRADRLPPRSEDPLRVIVSQVAQCLGLTAEVDVFVSPVRSREMDLVLTDPPAIVVGGGTASAYSVRELRFWVATLLSYVRNKTWISYDWDVSQLSTLVLGACVTVDPTFGRAQITDADAVAEMAAAVQRHLGRRARRGLEEVASTVMQHGAKLDYAGWVRAMQLTAMRTGLWTVNDLGTAASHLARLDFRAKEPSGSQDALETAAETATALRSHPLGPEIVRYWVGDDFLAAKRAANLV